MDNSGEPGRGVDITQWLLTCCPERSSTGCTGLFFGLPLFCTPARLLIGLDRGESGRTVETGVKKKIQEERKNKRVTQEIWPAPPAQVEGPTQDRSLAPGVQAQQAGTLSLKTEATPGSPGTT